MVYVLSNNMCFEVSMIGIAWEELDLPFVSLAKCVANSDAMVKIYRETKEEQN